MSQGPKIKFKMYILRKKKYKKLKLKKSLNNLFLQNKFKCVEQGKK